MSHSPRLFMRPLAVQPAPVPLDVVGTPPKYLPDLQYLTRLSITGGVGKFKAEVVSSNNLHPSAQIYVDNVTKELVIRWPPFKTNPPVLGLVRNGDFSDGLNFWEAKTPGWKIGSGQGGTDFPCLEFPGDILGEGYIDSEQVPCLPGDVINFGCDVQQGASAAGNAGGQAALVFINNAGEETVMRGTLVDDGANREYHPSRLLREAPADVRYVRGRLYGKRTRENKSVFFDNVTWDHAYSSGNNGTLPVDITIRVTDSMNRSVTKSYIILPYGAIRHFDGWEMVTDLGSTGNAQYCAMCFDPVSNLFLNVRVASRSLFTSPDGVTWTEMTNFFPFPLATGNISKWMAYSPDTGKCCAVGFSSSSDSSANRGYIFTVAGGPIVNTSSIGSSGGLTWNQSGWVTGTRYHTITGLSWTLDVDISQPSYGNDLWIRKPGSNWVRYFTNRSGYTRLASTLMTQPNTASAAMTRSERPLSEAFPDETGAPTSVAFFGIGWADDLGYGLAAVASNTAAQQGVYMITGPNDQPQRIATLPAVIGGPLSGQNRMFYVPWAGEWVFCMNINTGYTMVAGMGGTGWTTIQTPGLPANNGIGTSDIAISLSRETILFRAGRYIYRAKWRS